MIGKKAPAFALPDQDGKTHKLSDYKGKCVVLYWYPKDDTPGFVFTHENGIAA
ncbi:redoxin domain-containing protein [bacterium]|nr:redoxin domain-containing protein [bacterium]